MSLKVVIGLFMLVLPTSASAAPNLWDTDFGTPVEGLQLAASVNSTGKTVSFRLKNVGSRAIRIYDEFRCSGLGSWSITTGAAPNALDHPYHYDVKRKGLSPLPSRTRCTVNPPTKVRTIGAGKIVVIEVPLAPGEELASSKDRALQASAFLDVKGKPGSIVVLHSAVATR